jgi:hypothetical protein
MVDRRLCDDRSAGFFDDHRLKDCSTEWVSDLAISSATEEPAYIALDAWMEMLEGLAPRCADAHLAP